MEDITDADYVQAKRVCKNIEIKKLGEYYDLYVQSDKLLLADIFDNFRNMCINIQKLDPAKFLSASGYVQSDKLLLADIFDNFRNICINIQKLDPAKFLSASG